jgi:D-mannonate dehydratase
METSKDFLDKKVTPVMEPMMIELLLHKPEDPVSFMIQHLSGIVGQKEGKNKISL